MNEETISRKDRITMKLLHYFITEKNYSPIILQGVEDEIWLENLDAPYRIVRIVSNYIHNDEQLNFDLFKTGKIVKKIKGKMFAFKVKVLNIYTDLGDNVHLDKTINYDSMFLYEENDIDKYEFIFKSFPDIKDKLEFNETGLDLFIKITNDINQKNKVNADQAKDVFEAKKPVATSIIIIINLLIYFGFMLMGNYDSIVDRFCVYGPLIRSGEYYRLLTGIFLHGNIIHLLFNCYALWIIGIQVENYMGKWKYIIIYLFSGIMGSLFSITFSKYASIGASGAIFGLLGCILYFGYHYRVYLGSVIKSQIIPLIVFNLMFGFMLSGVDNFAHVGGLIGGVLITIALGVKYKSTTFEKTNGLIVTLLLTGFMIYMGILLPR